MSKPNFVNRIEILSAVRGQDEKGVCWTDVLLRVRSDAELEADTSDARELVRLVRSARDLFWEPKS